MFENIDAVLKDIDGCMNNSAKYHMAAVKSAITSMINRGLNAPSEEKAYDDFMQIYGENVNAKDHFNKLCKLYNERSIRGIVREGVVTFHNTQLSNLQAYPSVDHVLAILYGNVKLGVVSNGLEDEQTDKLIRLRFLPFFRRLDGIRVTDDYNVFAADDYRKKPSPNLFYVASKKMNIKLGRSVYIGDKLYSDGIGSKLAGIGFFIWVKQGKYGNIGPEQTLVNLKQNMDALTPSVHHEIKGKNEEELTKLVTPDYEINGFDQVLDILQEINQRFKKA